MELASQGVKMVRIHNLRIDYTIGTLSLKELDSDPYLQTEKWLEEAVNNDVLEPTAAALSTASLEAIPSCRMVLIKHWSKKGALFFTDYRSQKSQELLENSNACITFWWKEMERQLIISGTAKKTSRKESSDYFASRPKPSQVSASISHQGKVVESREELEKQAAALKKQKEIPLPSHWGGFILKPTLFQFWQGRKDRLHDRFLYTKEKGKWITTRLSP